MCKVVWAAALGDRGRGRELWFSARVMLLFCSFYMMSFFRFLLGRQCSTYPLQRPCHPNANWNCRTRGSLGVLPAGKLLCVLFINVILSMKVRNRRMRFLKRWKSICLEGPRIWAMWLFSWWGGYTLCNTFCGRCLFGIEAEIIVTDKNIHFGAHNGLCKGYKQASIVGAQAKADLPLVWSLS